METEGWLLHSQEPATCPYPNPDQFVPYLQPTSWLSILILLPIYYYHQRKADADVYHLIPSLPFAWTFQMTYSKANLNNGDKTSLIHAVPIKSTLECNLQQSHPFTWNHYSGCGLTDTRLDKECMYHENRKECSFGKSGRCRNIKDYSMS